jgi:hypothetical protein
VALPDDLQLRRRLSAWHQHHAGDPRGVVGHRGAPGIAPRQADPPTQSLWGDEPASDGAPASAAPSADAVAPPPVRGPRRILIRADGASRGNPGHASAGAVLIDNDAPDALSPAATPIATVSEYLGRQTNNVAEYTAVIRALQVARELGAREVEGYPLEWKKGPAPAAFAYTGVPALFTAAGYEPMPPVGTTNRLVYVKRKG